MTDYEFVKKVITERTIDPPKCFNVDELSAWLSGYAKCQIDILTLIGQIQEQDKQAR